MPDLNAVFANPNLLYASLLWGAIGSGFCFYGKKQGAAIPLVGGLLLLALSIFIPSALWMSLISLLAIAGMVWLIRSGY